MKQIIHMSDLHVGNEVIGDRFRVFIENLIRDIGDKPDNYVIVITGDLVENANTQRSYDEALSGLNRLKKAGFVHILAVPGNHDYGTGSHGDKKFVKLFRQAIFEDKNDYPRKNIIDDVAFIGLDSMAEELHWYDELCAQGELGERQLGALDGILNGDDVRSCSKCVIYLHHHPFHWRPLHQLKDSARLGEILCAAMKNGVSIDAMLFGHNHQGYSMNGRWGIPRCYDAGTATMKPRPGFMSWLPWFKANAATRLIDLERGPQSDRIVGIG